METHHYHSNKKTTEFLFDGVHGPFMVLEFEMVLPVPIAYASAWRMGETLSGTAQKYYLCSACFYGNLIKGKPIQHSLW